MDPEANGANIMQKDKRIHPQHEPLTPMNLFPIYTPKILLPVGCYIEGNGMRLQHRFFFKQKNNRNPCSFIFEGKDILAKKKKKKP